MMYEIIIAMVGMVLCVWLATILYIVFRILKPEPKKLFEFKLPMQPTGSDIEKLVKSLDALDPKDHVKLTMVDTDHVEKEKMFGLSECCRMVPMCHCGSVDWVCREFHIQPKSILVECKKCQEQMTVTP